jgi:hypothetical protein
MPRSVRRLLLPLCALVAWAVACGPARGPAEIEVALPTDVPRGLQLEWDRVSGADGYRLVFSRMTGAPVCTLFVDQAKRPGLLLVRDSLPAGLLSGWQLQLEVSAMRQGEALPGSGVRPLKTP